MKNIFKVGDKKVFERLVRQEDGASFEGSHIHPVYATFSITRDAEWCSRLFVLEMKEADEEGIEGQGSEAQGIEGEVPRHRHQDRRDGRSCHAQAQDAGDTGCPRWPRM